MSDEWIDLDEYCEKYNERRGTVTQRIADGTWERGEEYAIPDGKQAFIHEGRARAWLAEHKPENVPAEQ